MADTTTGALKRTPLHDIHAALGAQSRSKTAEANQTLKRSDGSFVFPRLGAVPVARR